MRKFNLEEAKAGKPVCARDGRNARIVCFDVKSEHYPIAALVEGEDGREFLNTYCIDGHLNYYDGPGGDNLSMLDLFMKTEKHEGWGWVGHSHISMFANLYNTKEEALSHKPDIGESFLAKVEWEE